MFHFTGEENIFINKISILMILINNNFNWEYLCGSRDYWIKYSIQFCLKAAEVAIIYLINYDTYLIIKS